MFRCRSLVVLFSLTAFLTAVRPAAADPIQIVSGFVSVGGVQDVLSRGFLRSIQYDFATDDFRLSGGEVDGPTQQILLPRLPHVAAFNIAPTDGPNAFIEAGVFTVIGTPGTEPSPFQLSGRLTIVDMVTRATLFDDTVFGHGTATWLFVPDPFGEGHVLSGARYDFSQLAATPEPASMILLGTGVLGILTRRSMRRAGIMKG